MFNTLRNVTNITSILDLTKYKIIHPLLHTSTTNDTNDRKRCFNLPYIRIRGCLNWFRFHKLGFKTTPVVFLLHHSGVGGRYNTYFPG